jgi:dCTP deaminase
MILSDFDLEHYIKEKRLVVKPFHKNLIRENGLDFRLAGEIAVRNKKLGEAFVLDPFNNEHLKREYIIKKDLKEFILPKASQVLLSTLEYIEMPNNLMGFVEIRSTWARHGLSMPPTILDAGFKGTVTLEIINNSGYAMRLIAGIRFAHIIFATTLNSVRKTYSGRYAGQKGIKLPKQMDRLS